jgi:hypothetical protein
MSYSRSGEKLVINNKSKTIYINGRYKYVRHNKTYMPLNEYKKLVNRKRGGWLGKKKPVEKLSDYQLIYNFMYIININTNKSKKCHNVDRSAVDNSINGAIIPNIDTYSFYGDIKDKDNKGKWFIYKINDKYKQDPQEAIIIIITDDSVLFNKLSGYGSLQHEMDNITDLLIDIANVLQY